MSKKHKSFKSLHHYFMVINTINQDLLETYASPNEKKGQRTRKDLHTREIIVFWECASNGRAKDRWRYVSGVFICLSTFYEIWIFRVLDHSMRNKGLRVRKSLSVLS